MCRFRAAPARAAGCFGAVGVKLCKATRRAGTEELRNAEAMLDSGIERERTGWQGTNDRCKEGIGLGMQQLREWVSRRRNEEGLT